LPPLPPWETSNRWSDEPSVPPAEEEGRSTEIRPPPVFVPVLLLLLLLPLTRIG